MTWWDEQSDERRTALTNAVTSARPRRYLDYTGASIGLPYTRPERADGVADIPATAMSMSRTARKTAALAATLRPVPSV